MKLIIKYSEKLNLIDIPNERSSHRNIVPRGAGIGFVLSLLINIAIYHPNIFMEYWYIFASILIVLIVGTIDDVYHAKPIVKIIMISLAVILLWINGISIKSLGSYFGYDIPLGWASLPFTLFALVAFTNALNLLDGIDGLAGIISLIIITFFGYIGYKNEDTLMMLLSLFTLASLSVFMILNYHPAKIFMGDSGSLTLGFIIAILAILSLKYIHPIVVLYLTALPVLDTLVVTIRRKRRGKPIFAPDNTHLHHILLKYIGEKDEKGHIKNGNRRTIWILALFQLIFSSIGLIINSAIYRANNSIPILSLLVFGAIFVIAYIFFTKLKVKNNLNDVP